VEQNESGSHVTFLVGDTVSSSSFVSGTACVVLVRCATNDADGRAEALPPIHRFLATTIELGGRQNRTLTRNCANPTQIQQTALKATQVISSPFSSQQTASPSVSHHPEFPFLISKTAP
jgi:hypothetical protein